MSPFYDLDDLAFHVVMVLVVLFLIGFAIWVPIYIHHRNEASRKCEARDGVYVRVYAGHYKCLDVKTK